MAMVQGNSAVIPVRVEDCRGAIINGSMVERGQFVFGAVEKYYGADGEVEWSDEEGAFLVPLTEEETFAFSGVVKYQARLLLKDGSISGSVPASEYIYESITRTRLSDGAVVRVSAGSVLRVSLLKEVGGVASNIVVDGVLSVESKNPVQNKVITTKINTVEAIAKGASQAIAYKTYAEAIEKINSFDVERLNVGQNIMIFTLNVPDLWVSGVEETSEPYTYVDDATIVELLKSQGFVRVGHYTVSELETGKVNVEAKPKTNTFILSGTNVLTSEQTFSNHIQIMVEFETDGIHAGFDCILHPYDEAVYFVTYDVLVNGQPNFGTAYLDDTGRVVINVPNGLTFTNVKASYVAYGVDVKANLLEDDSYSLSIKSEV